MQRLQNHLIGVDRGEVSLFADYQTGGEMWTGNGPRTRREPVAFSQAFRKPPVVQTWISLWDISTESAVRAEIVAEAVTSEGFEIVFRTWADTRVARIRAAWTAIGELPHDDDWALY